MKRFLTNLVIFSALCTAMGLLYGFYRFPDAPIRTCGTDCYQGKTGGPRSKDDFDGYSTWMMLMPVAFVATFGLGIVLYVSERRDKHASEDDA
jgi:hypothetical protein